MLAAGKPPKIALTACTGKLFVILNYMRKHQSLLVRGNHPVTASQ